MPESVTVGQARTLLLLAVVAVSLFAVLEIYSASGRQAQADQYGVAATLEQLAPALARLPADATRVVYLSDDPESLGFLSAQYAVAPRLLVSADHAAGVEWAIGRFGPAADAAALGAKAGFQVVEAPGSGVVLFRRAR